MLAKTQCSYRVLTEASLAQTVSTTLHAQSSTIKPVTDNNEQLAESDAVTARIENNLRTNYEETTGQANPIRTKADEFDCYTRAHNVQSLVRVVGKGPIDREGLMVRKLLLPNSELLNTQIGPNKTRNTKGNNWGGIAPEVRNTSVAIHTNIY